MGDDTQAQTGRNLVLCLDGTGSEPEAGVTNVARLYALAVKDDRQLVYYDPGVGTMGARGAVTSFGAWTTRVAGLIVGYGIKDNLAEAYEWLMAHYRPGDRIMLFGFSRGAYTAVALAGMLRTVGLLRPGAGNLTPYALKLYAARGSNKKQTDADEQRFWSTRSSFDTGFGNPAFRRFAKPVAFLGVWDTVKSVGWFNWKAQFEQARWPFTRNVDGVKVGRLALALDENRRAFTEYRFDPREVADPKRDLREVWFAGVHSDVGGQYEDDHRLSDIALDWMAREAETAGLRLDSKTYRKLLGVDQGVALPSQLATGRIHRHGWWWWILGLGWRRRHPRAGDTLDPSVDERVRVTAAEREPYRVMRERSHV